MNVHGGAYWLMGGKLSVKEGVGLAGVGRYRVVSVDYRHAPEHRFPAAVDDVVAVSDWEAVLNEIGDLADVAEIVERPLMQHL